MKKGKKREVKSKRWKKERKPGWRERHNVNRRGSKKKGKKIQKLKKEEK